MGSALLSKSFIYCSDSLNIRKQCSVDQIAVLPMQGLGGKVRLMRRKGSGGIIALRGCVLGDYLKSTVWSRLGSWRNQSLKGLCLRILCF